MEMKRKNSWMKRERKSSKEKMGATDVNEKKLVKKEKHTAAAAEH